MIQAANDDNNFLDGVELIDLRSTEPDSDRFSAPVAFWIVMAIVTLIWIIIGGLVWWLI
jgi:hypothetical protein